MSLLAMALLAGAAQIDVTPTWWPVIVNCFFLERQVSQVEQPIHAKALVLQRGTEKLALVVVDSCMMPRELIDQAKKMAAAATGIAEARMMISATHTHMAPAAMSCLGSRVDEKYAAWLPGKIAEAIGEANRKLAPARAGSFAVEDSDHTHVRQFFYRRDKMQLDPFGERSVHANMHPGYENPDMTLPTGPKDPTLTLLAVESSDGRPLALLANYAMHYFNSKPISSDYFGEFARQFTRRIGAGADYVVMLSQGVSGDLMWMDYARPQKKEVTLETYTRGLVDSAEKAFRAIRYESAPKLRMAEVEEEFERRRPGAARLAWARQLMAEMNGREPRNQPEVYAREQIHIEQQPKRKLKLQVLAVGDLGVAAWPNEVFSISGLKLRERTGFSKLMNVTLANGAEGYIPPAELHPFGGYTTWPAKTASLETGAEARIVARLEEMLAAMRKPRRPAGSKRGYWPLEELGPTQGMSWTGLHAFGVPGRQGRGVYLSGGGLRMDALGEEFSLSYWRWPVATRQWEEVVVEQRQGKRTVQAGGKTVEEGPARRGLVLKGFEGAVDEIRRRP
ncbi:MAG: hypothetical protein ACK532_00500 [Acidobacteriota bacterium]